MKHSEIKALRKFVGGYYKKGGQALGIACSPMTSMKGGQR